MTQRIKEIAEQAYTYAFEECKKNGRTGGVGDNVWVSLAMVKQFELLLSDVFRVMQRRYIGDHNREDMEVRRCIDDLKRHFGVE